MKHPLKKIFRYMKILNDDEKVIQYILLTRTTAAQNEVALSCHRVRGLYFLAVVFVRGIVYTLYNTYIMQYIHYVIHTIHYSIIYQLNMFYNFPHKTIVLAAFYTSHKNNCRAK